MHQHNTIIGSTAFRFRVPDFHFGDGVIHTLGDSLSKFGVTDPLIITDRGIKEAGILEIVMETVNAQPEVYYASTEPSTDDFDDIPIEDVDGVVALGGGSCIDTAKMTAILMAHGGHPSDYIGVDNVPGPVAPLIAIPTTSGTGSQATQTSVINYDGIKRGASSEYLRPDFAIVDPQLTFNLPREVTAHSGFDAFMHSLESLIARDYRWVEERPITYQGANPISRALSWRALQLIHSSLERAVFDGDDSEARRSMSLGSHLAGMAFSLSGLGTVHALASTVGGLKDYPHGACLAASVRAGLMYNQPVRKEQYATIAYELGVGSDSPGTTPPEALIAECERLRDSIGLPSSLNAVGLSRSDVDTIVENTLVQERRLASNPREVTDDLREFLLQKELEE